MWLQSPSFQPSIIAHCSFRLSPVLLTLDCWPLIRDPCLTPRHYHEMVGSRAWRIKAEKCLRNTLKLNHLPGSGWKENHDWKFQSRCPIPVDFTWLSPFQGGNISDRPVHTVIPVHNHALPDHMECPPYLEFWRKGLRSINTRTVFEKDPGSDSDDDSLESDVFFLLVFRFFPHSFSQVVSSSPCLSQL